MAALGGRGIEVWISGECRAAEQVVQVACRGVLGDRRGEVQVRLFGPCKEVRPRTLGDTVLVILSRSFVAHESMLCQRHTSAWSRREAEYCIAGALLYFFAGRGSCKRRAEGGRLKAC